MLSEQEQIEYLKLLEFKYQQLTRDRWLKGDLSFKLHEGQKQIYERLSSPHLSSEALIFCSRQWGKTYLVCVLALMYCLKNPYRLVRIAAPTLKQANDIVADTLDVLTRDAPFGLVTRNSSTYRWFVGKSSLRLGVLERAHVDTLRGAICHLAICEEGGFVSSDDYQYAVRSVLGPQLLHSKGRLIHVTTPSEDPMHHIHTEVLPRCEAKGSLFCYNIHSNPRLSADQIETAKTLAGGEGSVAWRREYLVEILRDSSLVCVPEFEETRHLWEGPLPEHAHHMIAMDVGGVRDKTVALLMCHDFLCDRILVVDERVFEANTASDVIVAEVKKMEGSLRITQRIADAPGQLLVDFMNKHDFQALGPRKDDFHAGINALRLLFSQDKVKITKKCSFLITTLKGATFNKNRTDFHRTEFLGHMDALAALIYGCRMMDRTQNPYPSEPRDPESLFYVTRPEKDAYESFADALLGRR
jgi:hypothetical protein